MSITSLHDLLDTYELEKDLDRGLAIGPSAVGALCRRQLAYTLTGTPTTDDVDRVTGATVGSMIHAGIAALWEEDPDTLGTEVEVPGGGHVDTFQEVDGVLVVRDLKTVNRSKFDRWQVNEGPPQSVWNQAAIYAGRLQSVDEDAQPALLVIDALCRETGRTETYQREYNRDEYLMAEARLETMDAYREGDPDEAPADRAGRGDHICDTCPWQSRCLGPDDRPNVSELSEEEVIDAAAEYRKWNTIANEAKRKADAARNLLRGTTGVFGGYEVRWTERTRNNAAREASVTTYNAITVKEV